MMQLYLVRFQILSPNQSGGKEVTVSVSYTDGYEAVESLISHPTDTVTNINDDPTGAVTIDGVFEQFETLTANTAL